ncbi:unnamed protein product, partial [Meganyctiphanes norvegica]
ISLLCFEEHIKMEYSSNSVYVEDPAYSNFAPSTSGIEEGVDKDLLDVIEIFNSEILGDIDIANSNISDDITQQIISNITSPINEIPHQIVPDHYEYPNLSELGNHFFFIDDIPKETKESQPTSTNLICFDCGIEFNDENDLGEHILMEHDNKFDCPECDFVCIDKKNLLKHLRNKHPQVVAECKENVKKIECIALDSDDDLSSFDEPYEIRNSDESENFELSSDSNTSKLKIYSHESLLKDILQTKDRPFSCNGCDFTCRTKGEVRQHKKLVHLPHKPFKCSSCNYRCKRKSDLQAHEIRHSIDDRPYQCLKCKYRCIGKSLLRKHMQTHARVKSYACLICSKELSSTLALNNHMMIHTGEKPFSCKECEFETRSSQSLNIHMRIHTGERPYACDQCDYRATSKNTLQGHKWRHVEVLDCHKDKLSMKFDL